MFPTRQSARRSTRRATWAGRNRRPRRTRTRSVYLLWNYHGEAEAIALALEMKADWLLIDEREGRAMARQLGMRVTGVLAVLLRGKKMGHLEAIKPEIDALRAKAHFFVAPDLERAVLSLAERGGLTILVGGSLSRATCPRDGGYVRVSRARDDGARGSVVLPVLIPRSGSATGCF
jgi:hypothetical protein